VSELERQNQQLSDEIDQLENEVNSLETRINSICRQWPDGDPPPECS
jgi:cell division protein FtsB